MKMKLDDIMIENLEEKAAIFNRKAVKLGIPSIVIFKKNRTSQVVEFYDDEELKPCGLTVHFSDVCVDYPIDNHSALIPAYRNFLKMLTNYNKTHGENTW